ncbi:hypothetical protein JT359_06890 [Candidatus Poribacteria bacterium]|nr:hypothetical protein [Candidatus Poribacteria bacterium]
MNSMELAELRAEVFAGVNYTEVGKLHNEINRRFDNDAPYRIVGDVILLIQEYAIKITGADILKKSENGIDEDTIGSIKEIVREELRKYISKFIMDHHRESMVRYHACGLTTSLAVTTLMNEDKTLNRLAQDDAMGEQPLRTILIPLLSYLKKGSYRFPKNKYEWAWDEGREYRINQLTEQPFSNIPEQMDLLAAHVQRIKTLLEDSETSSKQIPALTNSLTKTLDTINRLSVTQNRNLSKPNILSVLERMTQAINSDVELSENLNGPEIVEAVEKLLLTIRPLEQKAITG